MTPEERAARLLRFRSDICSPAFETAITAAIREAVDAAYHDAMLAVEEACTGFDGAGRMDDINAAIALRRQRAVARSEAEARRAASRAKPAPETL